MKYYNLPTLETLLAYKNGQLSGEKKKWVEQVAKENPLINEVMENTPANKSAVASISKKTGKAIKKMYFHRIGFWSKYGVWIGLSSILLILGLLSVFINTNSPKYTKQNIQLSKTIVKSSPLLVASESKERLTGDTKNSVVLATEKKNISSPNKRRGNQTISVTKTELEQKEGKSKSINKGTLKQEENKKKIASTKNKNKRRSSGSIFKTGHFSRNTTIVLAVRHIQILSKRFADKSSKREGQKNGSPFQNTSKTEKRSGRAFSNLPQFPGGKRGLINYLKGALHPIKVPKRVASMYDTDVRVDIFIKSNGKLDYYKVFGDFYPKHKEELKKAIQNMPRFSKGSGSTVYSVGISF